MANNMDLDYLKKILKMFDGSNITDLEIEEGELKVKLSKKTAESVAPTIQMMPSMPQHTIYSAPQRQIELENSQTKQETSAAEAVKDENIVTISAPMVGTFYRAPAPDVAPFVQIGQEINQETVVCILEAMKVMNEIKAEISGTIMEILVDNAQSVEYGQDLFKVRKT